MAITYIDQFILDRLKSLIQGFLSDSYIVKEEILPNLPDRLVTDFVDTYCNDDNHKGINIPVTMTFPQQSQNHPFVLVQFKQGVEAKEDASIGNVQGSVYNSLEGDSVVAKLPITTEGSQAYIELPEEVFKVYAVKETTTYKLSENRVYVPYFDFYKNGTHYMHITYARKTNKKEANMLPKGIVEQEQVVVDFCSTNMDTLRCMVGLLTATSIYLKDTLEANSDIELPSISTEGTDLIMEVNNPTESVSGQQIFYRRMTVTFKSLHTLPVNAGDNKYDYHLTPEIKDWRED